MNENLKVVGSTIALIEKFEGKENKMYRDTAALPTIGVGHLIKPNEKHLMTDILSEQQIIDLLAQDADVAVRAVHSNVKVPLNQSKFDSLLSFTFNEGASALAGSTLLKVINAGQIPEEHHFTDWDKDHEHGQLVEVKGLKTRRLAEYHNFISQ